MRLICFPHAGGAASSFFQWSRALAGQPIEIATLMLPGRESRIAEETRTDLAALVDDIGRVFRPTVSQPYAFFGHSMGAIVAFELTRWLRAAGLALPEYLFVSGCRAPHIVMEPLGLYNMPDDAQFLAEVGSRYGGVPAAVLTEPGLRSIVVPPLRADLAMNERYRCAPAPALPVPIAAFGGRDDRAVREAWLGEWREHTGRDFSLQMFPGDHFFIGPARDAVLAEIVRRLFPPPSVR